MARARLTHNTETPQVAGRNPLAMYQPSQGFVTKAFAIATQMGYDPSNQLRVKIPRSASQWGTNSVMVPESHALQSLFGELVNLHFDQEIGLRDSAVQDYIVNMLAEFCETDQLFKIRNANQRSLDDVGEMLLEADPVYGSTPSFDRERQVRKHIGDYTLFLAGMFPESINHFRLRRQRLENFVDFIKAGKESYFIVSKFDQFEYARLAPLFGKLSLEFESCVYGLNLVKGDLDEMQHPITRPARQIVM